MSDRDPRLGLDRIGQIALTVRDLPRAVAFYRDVLGMRFLFEAPGMAFFDCGDVRLMLGVPEGEESEPAASILYYRVADIGAAARELAARGARLQEEPRLIHRADDHDLWLAFLRDSEENLLALMSEVPRA